MSSLLAVTEREQEAYEQAISLIELMALPGWKRIPSLLADISQRHYPDPSSDTHKSWEEISIDYTKARGGTEVVKEFIQIMNQQQSIYDNIHSKKEKQGVRSKNEKR